MSERELILTLACPDQRGIVYAVARAIAEGGGNILDSQQFGDPVARVDHAHSVAELAPVGRDVECVALARAVRWHVDRRVLLHGDRTVVFR